MMSHITLDIRRTRIVFRGNIQPELTLNKE